MLSKARDNNVQVVIDAEQSWYQPVIDSLTDELTQTSAIPWMDPPPALRHSKPIFEGILSF